MTTASSAQSSASVDSSLSSVPPSLFSLSNSKFAPHLISIKLGEDNFLPWRQQALATIRGHKLQQYISSSSAVPPRFSSATNEANGVVSTDILAWEQQDQLLLSWLLASMTESMLIRMVGCDSSAQLRNLKKGSLSTSEYLLKLRKLIDSLYSVGFAVSDADHIEAILEGLLEDYTSFIVSVTSRSDPYTVGQIESLLLAHEERLDKFKKDSAPTLSANLAQSSVPSKDSSNSTSVLGNPHGSLFLAVLLLADLLSEVVSEVELLVVVVAGLMEATGLNVRFVGNLDTWHGPATIDSILALSVLFLLQLPDRHFSTIPLLCKLFLPHHNKVLLLVLGIRILVLQIISLLMLLTLVLLLHIVALSRFILPMGQATQKILLQGIVRDGLYVFDNLSLLP